MNRPRFSMRLAGNDGRLLIRQSGHHLFISLAVTQGDLFLSAIVLPEEIEIADYPSTTYLYVAPGVAIHLTRQEGDRVREFLAVFKQVTA